MELERIGGSDTYPDKTTCAAPFFTPGVLNNITITDDQNVIKMYCDPGGNTATTLRLTLVNQTYDINPDFGLISSSQTDYTLFDDSRLWDNTGFTLATPTPTPSSNGKHKAWSRGWYWGW